MENKSHGLARSSLLPGFLACILAVGAAGCTKKKTEGGGGAEPAKLVKLAFVTNNTSEFWKIAAAGVHKYEQEAKVQVDIKLPPNGTPEDQNQILQNLSSQGYDAIAVSVIAPNDQTGVLNKIAEKSTLLTFDSDAAEIESPALHRHQQLRRRPGAGRGDREAAAPRREDRGVRRDVLGRQRRAAAEGDRGRSIAGAGIEIVDKREDNTDRAKARANVEDIVNANRDLSMVVGLYNYNGTAIAAALEGLGKKGKVLAAVFDEDDGTLDGIANGSIQVTVVQKPFQFGYLASKWMHELATKPAEAKAALPADHVIDTGVDIINKENVAPFRATLAEMKKGT